MGGDGEDVVGEVEHCEGGALAENVHEEDAGEGEAVAEFLRIMLCHVMSCHAMPCHVMCVCVALR